MMLKLYSDKSVATWIGMKIMAFLSRMLGGGVILVSLAGEISFG